MLQKEEKKNIPYTQLKLQDNWELSWGVIPPTINHLELSTCLLRP